MLDSSEHGVLAQAGSSAYDKGKARIFGLHNYCDVNRKRIDRHEAAAAHGAGGQVWLTETGGILKFLPAFKRSE